MSDHRGWLMAEQEHAARLAAVKADYDAEIERLRRDNARMAWLIQNGERIFGSLWREASKRDIDSAMRAPDSAADQPKEVVCNCDDHDARYCVNRASRGSPCQCACHGANDTAGRSGADTTTGTPPTLPTSVDKPDAGRPCADCGEPTDVWHDGTHLCWKCRA